MMSIQNTRRFYGSPETLLTLLLIGYAVSGCGVKTYPKPIVQQPPAQINDLQSEVRGGAVELSWVVAPSQHKSEQSASWRFAVLKSEVPWDKRSCLECPAPEQTTILTIDPVHPEPAFLRDNRLVVKDASVATGRAYRYQIAIQDQKERVLTLSNPTIAKVTTPPLPPINVTVAKQNHGILLSWKEPKKDAAGQPVKQEMLYGVERRILNGSWEQISPAPVKGASFFDQAVASDQIYEYRVFGLLLFEGTNTWSGPSAVHQIKAPGALPPPPPSTVWAIPAKGVLEIHWTQSEGKVSGYHVYRREGKEITRLTSQAVQGPPYVDSTARPNVVYFYAVSAIGVEPPHPEGLLSKWAEIRNLQFQ